MPIKKSPKNSIENPSFEIYILIFKFYDEYYLVRNILNMFNFFNFC